MLSCGKALNTSRKESPVINSRVIIPNQRLLDKVAEYFKELNIPHDRARLCIGTGSQRVINFEIPFNHRYGGSKVLLYSVPSNGKSYLKAQLFCTRFDHFIDFSFIAQTPDQVLRKLLQFDLVPNGFKFSDLSKVVTDSIVKGGSSDR